MGNGVGNKEAAEATEKSVAEMREARDQETAPYVIAYFDVPSGSSLIYLVVKNIGQSTAARVKLVFEPLLRTSNNIPLLEELSFIKDGIASMPPNYEIRTLFDSAHTYFGNSELPLKYSVRISYFGGLQSVERVIEQTLDLSAHKGLIYVRHRGMDDLVKEVETLAKESREIRDAADSIAEILEKGILINNPSLAVTTLEPQMSKWSEALIVKVGEFENLWTISYKEERTEGFNLKRLKAHALLVSDQVLALLANRPDDAKDDLVNTASDVAKRLHELSRIMFYADGGASLKAFNDLGDAIVDDIKKIREANQKNIQPAAEVD